MTPALTPRRALDYLRELSTDVRDGVVLGPDGSLLAGSPALAGPARDLLAAAGDGADAIQVDLARGAELLQALQGVGDGLALPGQAQRRLSHGSPPARAARRPPAR